MRVHISNRVYDTDTASVVRVVFFPDHSEALYCKRQTGEYFLHVAGNDGSRYKCRGKGSTLKCHIILVFSRTQARIWLQLYFARDIRTCII